MFKKPKTPLARNLRQSFAISEVSSAYNVSHLELRDILQISNQWTRRQFIADTLKMSFSLAAAGSLIHCASKNKSSSLKQIPSQNLNADTKIAIIWWGSCRFKLRLYFKKSWST